MTNVKNKLFFQFFSHTAVMTLSASILTFSFKLFCYGSLLLNFIRTASIYFEYETVTRIEYERLKDLPSLTVCLPRLYPKLAIDSILAEYGYNYTALAINSADMNAFRKTEIYNFYIKNEFKLCGSFNSCDLSKLITESIPYFNKTMTFWFYGSKRKFFQKFRLRNNLLFSRYLNPEVNIKKAMPVAEFIVADYNRCFAFGTRYWDQLREESSENTFKFKAASFDKLQVGVGEYFYVNDSVLLGLFSPTDIPFSNSMSQLEEKIDSNLIELNYHQLKVERLPPPFRTGCQVYGFSPSSFQCQADCITKCIFRSLIQENPYFYHLYRANVFTLELSKYFIPSNLFLETEIKNLSMVRENINWDNFNEEHGKLFNFTKSCPKRCPVDCTAWTYIVSKKMPPDYSKFFENYKKPKPKRIRSVNFAVEHDDIFDIYLKHSPLMDWVTFLGTVGGLAGMWIGFSFLHFPAVVFRFLKHFQRSSRVAPNRQSVKIDRRNFTIQRAW